MRCWGILFGVVVVVAGCAGKSSSDDDDSGGSGNDAGQGGTAGSVGGTSNRGGTTGGTLSGGGTTGGTLSGGATTGGTLSGGGTTGGTLSGGGTTGGTLSGGTGGGGTGGSVEVCTDLSAQAPSFQEVYSAGVPPTPQGGTIQSGTYYLALETYYGATAECADSVGLLQSLGYQLSEVVRFTAASASAGSMEVAAHLTATSAGLDQLVTGAGSYSASGTSLSILGTCGEGVGSPGPVEFTATADQLVLFSSTSDVCDSVVAVFQRP